MHRGRYEAAMARPLRLEFEGAVYHVTARGNAQAPIYEDGADRRRFLDLLWRTVARRGWLCHAYCLMGNHYHLVLETPAANLSRGMRDLNGMYTQAFNRCHDRSGHVFQGRYHAVLVERDAHLLELCRYVVLKSGPCRAGGPDGGLAVEQLSRRPRGSLAAPSISASTGCSASSLAPAAPRSGPTSPSSPGAPSRSGTT